MSKQELTLLDEMFGSNAIKPMARILYKLTSELDSYSDLIKAMEFLIEKYPEEALVELVDTVSPAERLLPFITESNAA